jgi:hypothetical protein
MRTLSGRERPRPEAATSRTRSKDATLSTAMFGGGGMNVVGCPSVCSDVIYLKLLK